MRLRLLILAGVGAVILASCGEKKSVDAASDTGTGQGSDQESAVQDGADASDGEIAPLNDLDFEKLSADNAVASEKFLAENAAREGVKITESGLQYLALEEGPADGAVPASGDMIDVHYVGTKIDGVEFDSSRSQGAAARFPLAEVESSWTGEAVKMMSVGDKYRFFVPAEIGYGVEGTPDGVIGPNEALIYDVELVNVSNSALNLEAAKRFLAANKSKPGIKSTESGLQYEVISEGAADAVSPIDANVVSVHYEGTLVNGTIFDSSYSRGQPTEFPLGRVIAGWTEGLQLMKVGDKFRFFIPPELAYGETPPPTSPIGPNEALVFEVELLEVK